MEKNCGKTKQNVKKYKKIVKYYLGNVYSSISFQNTTFEICPFW